MANSFMNLRKKRRSEKKERKREKCRRKIIYFICRVIKIIYNELKKQKNTLFNDYYIVTKQNPIYIQINTHT
jgi:hypothetical protein